MSVTDMKIPAKDAASEIYEQLREALERGGRPGSSARSLAERFWPGTAEKPPPRRPGPEGRAASALRGARLRRAGAKGGEWREDCGSRAAGALRAGRRRDLRGQARRRAPRARPRGGARDRPVQVVSGRARVDAAVPLGLLDL